MTYVDPDTDGGRYGYAAADGYAASYGGYVYDQASRYDAAYGTFYLHTSFFDPSGYYDAEAYDVRGRAYDVMNVYIENAYGGYFLQDSQHTSTSLDGTYRTYGTRSTLTYNSYYNTSTGDYVSFDQQQSYSIFSSYDYATGASVTAYDNRQFYAYGFYEYTVSSYFGDGAYSTSAYGAYHPTG